MPYCQCNGIDLYYEEAGSGWPLLLISGLGGGCWSWYGQVPYFKSVYRVITFDNRGAGRSGMPDGPYDIKQFAADARCLLDHLKLDKVFVMALSMGGMIAQELALLDPRRLRALVLGCTHCGGPKRIPPSPRVLETLLDNNGMSQKEIIEKNVPIFFSEGARREQPEAISAYCEAQLSAPEQPEFAFRAQLAAIGTFDASARLSRLKLPTLIVAGSEDVLVPPENAQFMTKQLVQSEMVILPGAGHALHAECCDTLNSLADHFFKRFRGGVAAAGS
jgi:3-oxoadipate enol-lactonase